MDRISFFVTLIHSYSDHKLNVSSDNSKVVGTIILFKSSPVRKFSGSRAVSRAPVPIYMMVISWGRVYLVIYAIHDIKVLQYCPTCYVIRMMLQGCDECL